MESGTTSSALDKLDQTNSIGCLRKRRQAQREDHVGLAFLPPDHASKIHVHTVDNDGDPDDAARPANK